MIRCQKTVFPDAKGFSGGTADCYPLPAYRLGGRGTTLPSLASPIYGGRRTAKGGIIKLAAPAATATL